MWNLKTYNFCKRVFRVENIFLKIKKKSFLSNYDYFYVFLLSLEIKGPPCGKDFDFYKTVSR